MSTSQATNLTVTRSITQQETTTNAGVIIGIVAGSVALVSALVIGAYKLGQSGFQFGKIVPEDGR